MTEEVEDEVMEVNPISRMIDYITQAEYQKANEFFNDALSQRVSDALEQEKVAVAQSIYSNEPEVEDSEDDEVDDEFTEEELEDALEEIDDEEDDES